MAKTLDDMALRTLFRLDGRTESSATPYTNAARYPSSRDLRGASMPGKSVNFGNAALEAERTRAPLHGGREDAPAG